MASKKIIFIIFNIIPLYIISTLGLGYGWTFLHSENADNINNVLLNLSYSYVAALIFYILYDYIPAKRNEYKAFLMIKPTLKDIYSLTDEIIGKLLMVYDVEIDREALSIEALASCTHYNPSFKRTYYQKYSIKNGVNKKLWKGVFDFWFDLEECSKKIKKKIDLLKDSPSFRYIDSNLIALLSELEQDELLKIYHQINQYPLSYNEFRELHHFPRKIYDFNIICLRLKKRLKINEVISYKKLSYDEKVAMDVQHAVVFKRLKESEMIRDNALVYFNNVQYKIRKGELI